MDSHVVLLDTNIWVHKSCLLRRPLGASLVHSLARNGRKLAVPEVVEQEIRVNAKTYALELAGKAAANLETLRYMVGRPLAIRLPDADMIESDISIRLQELGPVIRRYPLTLAHAKAALKRVVEKQCPSSNGQQFKDCVIWETALELAQTTSVYLISEDRVFFDPDKSRSTSALAPQLQVEAARLPNKIIAYTGLQAYLEEHGVRAHPLDDAQLRVMVEHEARRALAWMTHGQSVVFGKLTRFKCTPYLSDHPTEVVYGFSVAFDATVSEPAEGLVLFGTIAAEGELVYEPTSNAVDEAEISSLEFRLATGETVMMWANPPFSDDSSDGRRKPVFGIRHPLA